MGEAKRRQDIMRFPFTRWSSPRSAKSARIPDGQRVYAIGDVHGRLDLLEHMHRLIAAHAAARPAAHTILVYLGDYVDRGPHSAGVVDQLIADPPPGWERVLLCGNHEEMLLSFVADPAAGTVWRQLGGHETLLSYRVPVGEAMQSGGFTGLARVFQTMLPMSHLRFFNALSSCVTIGDYFFCHAGVRPGVPLDQQSTRDLLWIRSEFLDSTADHGRVVVHGHSPVETVEIHANRINVDTGAYATNRLSCVVLEGTGREILST